MYNIALLLTQHPDRELTWGLQILDNALRDNPHVILASDLVIPSGGQDVNSLLSGRVEQHHAGLTVDQLEQIVRFGDQNGAQYGELECVLHVGDSLSDRLYEVVVTSYLRGDYAELMPLVPLQDTQHGRGLVFQRRCQLQLQAALRRSLQTNGISVMSFTRISPWRHRILFGRTYFRPLTPVSRIIQERCQEIWHGAELLSKPRSWFRTLRYIDIRRFDMHLSMREGKKWEIHSRGSIARRGGTSS